MNPRTFAKSLVVLLPLAGFGSCGLFGGGDAAGLAQVDDLVGWVERVHVNAEASKERAQAAMDRLQSIANSNFGGDPVEAYAGLVQVIEASEEQARVFKETVKSMRETAGPVFERWTRDLMDFSSTEMRLRSQNRLLATRERYDAVVAAVGPAQISYDHFNKGMRDHALFLGHDFNPASVAEIGEDVRSMGKMVADLEEKMDECLAAARAYVEGSALPTTAGTHTGSPAPGGSAPANPTMRGTRPNASPRIKPRPRVQGQGSNNTMRPRSNTLRPPKSDNNR